MINSCEYMNVSSVVRPFCFKSKRFGISDKNVRAHISEFRSYGFFIEQMFTNRRGYVAIKMVKRYGKESR